MASTTKEVAKEFPPLVRIYKDGSVERIVGPQHDVPPSPDGDPQTGVSSKDVTISQNPPVSARLYLPKLTTQTHDKKLPIFVYFHGGGFCVGSAFSSFIHRYIDLLVSQAQVVAVSVEYRLAPENPLPAAYEDCWTALQWVASHYKTVNDSTKDPWLLNHGDFQRVFIGGDSGGGNIAHNIAMRAGVESLNGGVNIFGAVFSHPFFWGSEPVGSEPRENREKGWSCLLWDFVYPSAPGGIDNPMVNPVGSGKPSLAKLGCSKLLVCVAEKDELRDRGVLIYNAVKESGFGGEVELFESEGGNHGFHYFDVQTENAKNLIKRLASFMQL